MKQYASELRIIGGKYKSRRISLPKSSKNGRNRILPLRPTSDRARETLFDVLNNIIDYESISCLDLFAGTGALGFETLSRGASEVLFVDKSGINIKMINKSAQELGCQKQITTCKEEAVVYLNGNSNRFDLVFADPPYDYECYPELVESVLRTKPQLFVLETSIGEKQNYNVNGYETIVKQVGTAKFHIFSAK